jgi:hypothetical protein
MKVHTLRVGKWMLKWWRETLESGVTVFRCIRVEVRRGLQRHHEPQLFTNRADLARFLFRKSQALRSAYA